MAWLAITIKMDLSEEEFREALKKKGSSTWREIVLEALEIEGPQRRIGRPTASETAARLVDRRPLTYNNPLSRDGPIQFGPEGDQKPAGPLDDLFDEKGLEEGQRRRRTGRDD